MKRTRHSAYALRILLILAFPSVRPAAGKPPPLASTMSFEQRIQGSPFNRVLEKDGIVFPHTDAGFLSAPLAISAGKLAVNYPDVDRTVWAIGPRHDKTAQYLARRNELLKTGDQALIDWCIRNQLPLAAEFELRRVLRRIWDFRTPEYQRFRKQWAVFADKRSVAYTFPLPARGEWFVLPDNTGHHRVKHGAAFAFDLVIQQAGRSFRGNGRRLEDHYCWGHPILAQADGVVTQAEDCNPDVQPGQSGGFDNANFVSVYYGAGISGFYGHIQYGSLRVKLGQRVAAGDVLAAVGNSGASGCPHLHFTLMDQSNFSVKGRFAYEVKRGYQWIPKNGETLPENAFVRDWLPKDVPPPAPPPAGASLQPAPGGARAAGAPEPE
jgi:hypothetical protein